MPTLFKLISIHLIIICARTHFSVQVSTKILHQRSCLPVTHIQKNPLCVLHHLARIILVFYASADDFLTDLTENSLWHPYLSLGNLMKSWFILFIQFPWIRIFLSWTWSALPFVLLQDSAPYVGTGRIDCPFQDYIIKQTGYMILPKGLTRRKAKCAKTNKLGRS